MYKFRLFLCIRGLLVVSLSPYFCKIEVITTTGGSLLLLPKAFRLPFSERKLAKITGDVGNGGLRAVSANRHRSFLFLFLLKVLGYICHLKVI